MIDLILIIMIIVSLAKPNILLSKKMKEKANIFAILFFTISVPAIKENSKIIKELNGIV